MSLPSTSLIIASRDRPDLLEDTVASVLKGDEVPAEMVIVDQSRIPHSTLGKLTASRGCEISYLNVNSVGVSRARNAGIAAAQHDMLIVIDDDIYVDGRWFTHMVEALTKGGIQTVVSGQVRPYFSDNQGGFVPSTNVAEKPIRYQGRIYRDVLFTASMAIHRAAFEAVGLFDERLGPGTPFPSAEDCDLGFRLLEAGFYILYEPEAVVYHRAWRSDRDFLPLRWNYGLGRGAFYAKHFHLKDRYMLKRMLTDIQNHVLAFPFRYRRQRLEANGDLVLSWGILVGAFRWLTVERNKKATGKP
jgi:GT2 family glycosyltransferase